MIEAKCTYCSELIICLHHSGRLYKCKECKLYRCDNCFYKVNKDKYYIDYFSEALNRNNYNEIFYLINTINLNDRDHFNNSPLNLAIRYRIYPDIINKMIDIGVDMADKNGNDHVLFDALEYCDKDSQITHRLIDMCSNVNAQNFNDETILTAALFFNQVTIVNKLLDKGADVNIRPDRGYSSLMIALEFCNNSHVINRLIDMGADINIENDDGTTPLMLALKHCKDSDIIERIRALSV